MTLCKE